MAVLEIKKYPEKILKAKALPVGEVDEKIHRLIEDMVETMYASSGVGLAAPQIGISKRLIVVDVSQKGEKMPVIALINPEILSSEGDAQAQEGCLSLPDFTANISRAEKIMVSGLDKKGKPVLIRGEGLLARALQHEIDHLDGVLLLDKVSGIKREFFKKKIKKASLARV